MQIAKFSCKLYCCNMSMPSIKGTRAKCPQTAHTSRMRGEQAVNGNVVRMHCVFNGMSGT